MISNEKILHATAYSSLHVRLSKKAFEDFESFKIAHLNYSREITEEILKLLSVII